MPDRPLTVAAYAAGASLAAVTLVYVLSPTLFLEDRTSNGWMSSKRGIIGLQNLANDCFINSVLQALAGLGDLRVHLIQEIHRRSLDDPRVYAAALEDEPDKPPKSQATRRKQAVLLDGLITKALKEMLDRLNERPLTSKTISAAPFIRSLELSFNTRVNRQQQDAQEFFQVVAERLLDECLIVRKARRAARQRGIRTSQTEEAPDTRDVADKELVETETKAEDDDDDKVVPPSNFPFEGKTETIIACRVCGFQPKPNVSTFVNLTLNVPQKASTTLDHCLDGLMKQEIINDYACDRCRLTHALGLKKQALQRASREAEQTKLESEISKIQAAIDHDPEDPPQDANLPEAKYAPKCSISKHSRIHTYPKTLVVHLSRSVYDMYSTKNPCKVSFEEKMTLGGLVERRKYRLLALITHRGGHNSGHYETFRRQIIDSPYSPPNSLDPSRNSTSADALSPSMAPSAPPTDDVSSIETNSRLSRVPSLRPPSTRPSISSTAKEKARLRKRNSDKWWRMSDETVRECRTANVLAMQKDAYLLFYELESPN